MKTLHEIKTILAKHKEEVMIIGETVIMQVIKKIKKLKWIFSIHRLIFLMALRVEE